MMSIHDRLIRCISTDANVTQLVRELLQYFVMGTRFFGFFRTAQPVQLFVVIAAVFGLAFLLITPPFQGADEPAHFLRAYQISEGQFVSTKAADGKIGGYLPADVDKIIDVTANPSVQFHPELKYGEGRTKQALAVPRSHQYRFEQFPSSALYPPTAYPLSSLGIFVSRILHLPTMVSLYAARLGNLVTWIVLFGAAIYFLPSRKWAMVAVGLLPMAIFQAATLNGDVITLGTLALLLSMILKLRHDKTRLTLRYGSLMVLDATLMVLSKEVMFLFLPLVLLLRSENFSSVRRAWLFKAAVAVIPLVIFGAWLGFSHTVSVPTYSNGTDPTKQLHHIVAKPYAYAYVLWNTYFFTWGDGVTRGIIGTFGWVDAPLAEDIVVVGYIGLFLLLASTYEKNYKEDLSKRSKQLLWLLALLYVLAVSTALYLSYSPVGLRIVYGLQGRYYIPLAILAVPLLRTHKLVLDPATYKRLAVVLPLFLLSASTITLFVRYFVHNV